MKTTTTKTKTKTNQLFETLINTLYVGGFLCMFVFTILQIINN